ncbi:MAG: hypothetical protein PF447_02000 [Spirochaetaceae bacterium]|jgi:hypothetical protein|nr:hypothetical protein [Spirochaetaceae bacterium]
MDYTLIVIKVDGRERKAIEVQDILTKYGCAIKVRLGLHDLPSQACSSTGLIVLEVEGEEVSDLLKSLDEVDGIVVKKVEV